MKVLLIAYHFPPFLGVGAMRLSYWHDNLLRHGINSTVVTATYQEIKNSTIHYVKDLQKKTPLTLLIKDRGLSWKNDLVNFFKKNHPIINYDIILISGGPFFHFSIGKYFKKNCNAKVVLDYRDPFSKNPLFKDNIFKRLVKSYLEHSFNKYADALITVNKYCSKLIKARGKFICIIDNGYNEEIIKNLDDGEKLLNNKINLVFTGSLSSDPVDYFPFQKFLMENDAYFFHLVGSSSTEMNGLSSNHFKYYEYLPYLESIKLLNRADIAILFTHGCDFKSSTKIFDYIALNKKIIIITESNIKTGNIHEITKDYPNVEWTINSSKDIEISIKLLNNQELISYNPYKYSRKAGLMKLIKIFNNLTSNDK